MSGRNPYKDLYTNNTVRKELNLREEMNKTLYGATDEIPKGQQGFLRKVRRDSNGDKVRCPCRDSNTTEPSREYYCRYCLSLGYYWDEIPVIYYKNSKAYKYVEGWSKEYTNNVFYFEYNVEITDDDYIITLKRDNEGKLIQPVEREETYRVLKVIKPRSDTGRVEYILTRAVYERMWSTWYGVKHRRLD